MGTNKDKLLTYEEVAEHLHVSYSRVVQLVAAKEIDAESFGKYRRIRESELRKLLASRVIPDALPAREVVAP